MGCTGDPANPEWDRRGEDSNGDPTLGDPQQAALEARVWSCASGCSGLHPQPRLNALTRSRLAPGRGFLDEAHGPGHCYPLALLPHP